MTMKKKYQVFLSSTYIDLAEERSSVMQTLLEMDFIPCGMELFPAADEDQWTLIKKIIDECDYYIVIVAGRYGSIGPDGKSYTQLEYEYALSKGKPIISFLHEKHENLPNNKCEQTEDGKNKLKEFRKICQKKLVKYWNNPENLGGVVYTSLSKLVQSKPAIDWIRADQLNLVDKTMEVNAENFFYTLDEKIGTNFTDLIKGAKSVSILARTAVNLLSQYERNLSDLCKNDCLVKLLFISPKSDATKYVYGSNPEVFEENIRKMNFHLSRLKQKNENMFSAKSIKHAPTTSLILIEKEKPEDSFIVVQLYFLHSRISRDRPLFKIFSTDKWYSAFYEEFNQLWVDGENAI